MRISAEVSLPAFACFEKGYAITFPPFIGGGLGNMGFCKRDLLFQSLCVVDSQVLIDHFMEEFVGDISLFAIESFPLHVGLPIFIVLEELTATFVKLCFVYQ